MLISDESHPSEDPAAALDRLRSIAQGIPDRELGTRLCAVFEEAARTISGLGNLATGKLDDVVETGTPDLSTWEELAPVMRDTLLDINRLLARVRELFPRDAGAGTRLAASKEEVAQQILSRADAITAEVTNLGERMRSPQIVSDHWHLLSGLQEFRGKFRALVGDMIYFAASSFGPVSRSEVVPGYLDDLRDALAERRAVIDLARVTAAHCHRIVTSAAEQFPSSFAALMRDLDAFGRSRAYTALRTADKRRFAEFQGLMRRLPPDSSPASIALIRELTDFTQGLWNINRRAMLVDHDREVLAECAMLLEKAQGVSEPTQARTLLVTAVTTAQDLYGRHVELDAYLRKARKRDVDALADADVRCEIELLRERIVTASAL